MEWLFGKRMTPEEMLRKNQRALNKAMRDLDREKMKMEQQEKKIIMDIKKLAKEGQMVSGNQSLADYSSTFSFIVRVLRLFCLSTLQGNQSRSNEVITQIHNLINNKKHACLFPLVGGSFFRMQLKSWRKTWCEHVATRKSSC